MGLWIWCVSKNTVFTMGWKKLAETEKGTVGQVKSASNAKSVFKIEGVVHHDSYVRRKL
jgi:hypothetical protein